MKMLPNTHHLVRQGANMRRGFTLIEPSHAVALSPRRRGSTSAFTLIELSIVLVIIGLIVGGVLVGQDLIKASQIRQQISQIEKFDTAIMTFKLKYNSVPGDISLANAAAFGLTARNGSLSCGDGNGFIGSFFVVDGGGDIDAQDYGRYGSCYANGGDESQLFWSDLLETNLITGVESNAIPSQALWTTILPKSKLNNAYIVAAHGGMDIDGSPSFGYYFIAYESPAGNQFTAFADPYAALSNLEAYAIDAKIDDENAISGKVYTLDKVPEYRRSITRGVMVGCATDIGGGKAVYDITIPAEKVCVVKIRGIL